jgi:hypothetical protein
MDKKSMLMNRSDDDVGFSSIKTYEYEISKYSPL